MDVWTAWETVTQLVECLDWEMPRPDEIRDEFEDMVSRYENDIAREIQNRGLDL